MANPIRLTNKLLVCPQLQIEDLAALNAAGIRTIICNRPDSEGAGQPYAESIAAAARQLGMTFTHVPVTAKIEMTKDAVAQFNEALESAPSEVVAYCRSGKRSAIMWALTQRGKMPVEEILRTTAQSGFDLGGMADRLVPETEKSPAVETGETAKKIGFWSRIFGRR